MSGMAPAGSLTAPPLPDGPAIIRWARTAKPGDEIVYARGANLLRNDAVEEARTLHDRGLVILVQRRVDGVINYLAIRRKVAAPVPPRDRISRMTETDDAFDRVMRCLKRAANLDRVCPTDVELAKTCGLKDKHAAAYIVRCAVERQLIHVVDRRPKRRIVRILATGRATRAN